MNKELSILSGKMSTNFGCLIEIIIDLTCLFKNAFCIAMFHGLMKGMEVAC